MTKKEALKFFKDENNVQALTSLQMQTLLKRLLPIAKRKVPGIDYVMGQEVGMHLIDRDEYPVVSCWSPVDVEAQWDYLHDYKEGLPLEIAKEWLETHKEVLIDQLAEHGNGTIEVLLREHPPATNYEKWLKDNYKKPVDDGEQK